MPARLTRRAALESGAAALGGGAAVNAGRAAAAALGGSAAVALGACGGGDPPPAEGPEAGSGAALLGSLAALEHASAAAWDAIGRRLRGEGRRYAAAIAERERAHAERLSALIRDLGGEPPGGRPPGEYEPQFPLMRTEGEALRFAADLEEQLIREHLDALRSLPREDQRRAVAEIAAEEAEDLAVARTLGGEPAAQHPFVTGML
jgi:ferritin-like protein